MKKTKLKSVCVQLPEPLIKKTKTLAVKLGMPMYKVTEIALKEFIERKPSVKVGS